MTLIAHGLEIGRQASVFTIYNWGDGVLQLDANSLTLPSGFSLASGFSSTQVAGTGGSATFTIQFDAGAAGTYNGQLSFTSNDPDESPYNFTLIAEATIEKPEVDVQVNSMSLADGAGQVDFGSTEIGAALSETFTIYNWGSQDLSIDVNSFSLPSGFTLTQAPDTTVYPWGGTTSFTVELSA